MSAPDDLERRRKHRQPRPCSVDACDKPREGLKEVCHMHSERLRRWGSTDGRPSRWAEGERCTFAGCKRRGQQRGLCRQHYAELRDLDQLPPAMSPPRRDAAPAWERALARTNFDGPCWEYRGTKRARGYGVIVVGPGRKAQAAHRAVWEGLVGPVPAGLVLDHLCRNTSCVNPDHLEPVTQAENIRRGYAPAALNARKTHCSKGHEFTPENTARRSGRRVCLTCRPSEVAA